MLLVELDGYAAVVVCGEADSQSGFTALRFAASRNQIECMRLLINAGADKDVKCKVRAGRYFAAERSLIFIHYSARFCIDEWLRCGAALHGLAFFTEALAGELSLHEIA